MSNSRVILTIKTPKYKARPSESKKDWVVIEKNAAVEKCLVDLSNRLASTVAGVGSRLAAQFSQHSFQYSKRGSKFVCKFEVPPELKEHCDINQVVGRANEAMSDALALLSDWAGHCVDDSLADVRLAAHPAATRTGNPNTILVTNADAVELVRPLAKLVQSMAADARFAEATLAFGKANRPLGVGLPKTMERAQIDSTRKITIEGEVNRPDGTRHTVAIMVSSRNQGRQTLVVDYSACPSPSETRELLGYAFAHQEPVVVTGYRVYRQTPAGRMTTNRMDASRIEAALPSLAEAS